MHRIYYTGEIAGESIAISDIPQLHHLRDVLRLKVGDEATVFDGKGNEYRCVVNSLSRTEAVLSVKAKKRVTDRQIQITVACAIPKKSRMDEVIDNLTQLGVDSIIPLETGRVIVRLDESRKENRLERWRRIASSAAAQSQRNSIPQVEAVTGMESLLSRAGEFDLKIIPTLYGERQRLREVLADCKPGSILVLIGPEGDFTPEEVERAKNAGFIPVSLGDSVLRVATAATAVVSYIVFYLGD